MSPTQRLIPFNPGPPHPHAAPDLPTRLPTPNPAPLPTPAVDLDQAYGAMSASNYADLARQQPPARRQLGSTSATEGALLGERDAVMLSALHQASLRW